MGCPCCLTETLGWFCFQSRGSAWINTFNCGLSEPASLHKLAVVNFSEPVFSKDFWHAWPEVVLITVFSSMPSVLPFKAWKDMDSLRLSMMAKSLEFFGISFPPHKSHILFWFWILSQISSIHTTAGWFKSILYVALSYSNNLSWILEAFIHFFWWIGYPKSLLFRLEVRLYINRWVAAEKNKEIWDLFYTHFTFEILALVKSTAIMFTEFTEIRILQASSVGLPRACVY